MKRKASFPFAFLSIFRNFANKSINLLKLFRNDLQADILEIIDRNDGNAPHYARYIEGTIIWWWKWNLH